MCFIELCSQTTINHLDVPSLEMLSSTDVQRKGWSRRVKKDRGVGESLGGKHHELRKAQMRLKVCFKELERGQTSGGDEWTKKQWVRN